MKAVGNALASRADGGEEAALFFLLQFDSRVFEAYWPELIFPYPRRRSAFHVALIKMMAAARSLL